MIDASATRRFATPRTLREESTAAVSSSTLPILGGKSYHRVSQSGVVDECKTFVMRRLCGAPFFVFRAQGQTMCTISASVVTGRDKD